MCPRVVSISMLPCQCNIDCNMIKDSSSPCNLAHHSMLDWGQWWTILKDHPLLWRYIRWNISMQIVLLETTCVVRKVDVILDNFLVKEKYEKWLNHGCCSLQHGFCKGSTPSWIRKQFHLASFPLALIRMHTGTVCQISSWKPHTVKFKFLENIICLCHRYSPS